MITMKDVIREGNPLLKQKSADVKIPLSKEDEELIISMMEYVYNSCDPEMNEKYDLRPAVGLAAPQLGILKKMIAIVAPDESGNEHEFALINPKLLSYSDELTYLEVISKGLKVMDSTASSLCMDNNIPLLVFGLDDPANIIKVLNGEKIGTVVK